MQRLKLTALGALIIFALPIASVFGAGYPIATPILGTTGAPALASPSLYSGILNVLYADGRPVDLSASTVAFELCAASCTTVEASLKQTAPGTYAYTFTPPSTLTGTITIFVKSGSLADENGRIFPSVDTQIGTYASTKTTSNLPADQIPSSSTSSQSAPVASPESTKETKEAVSTTQPTQQSPLLEVLLSLALLGVAAFGLLFFPRQI